MVPMKASGLDFGKGNDQCCEVIVMKNGTVLKILKEPDLEMLGNSFQHFYPKTNQSHES